MVANIVGQKSFAGQTIFAAHFPISKLTLHEIVVCFFPRVFICFGLQTETGSPQGRIRFHRRSPVAGRF